MMYISLTCKCGHKFRCKAPSAPGYYSVKCTNPECGASVRFHYPPDSASEQNKQEKESEKISLTCKCGHKFRCKAPSAPGYYSVKCTNPDCGAKVGFHFPLVSGSEQKKPDEKKSDEKLKLGLMEDGSYRFRCDNPDCRQVVKVPAALVKTGLNTVKCPKCPTFHKFEVKPSEGDLLMCETSGCGGVLDKPDSDGPSTCVCKKCGTEYSVTVENGKVVKVIAKTKPVYSGRQSQMKLVLDKFLDRKEYFLTKGIHYIGRADDQFIPDYFGIKDRYASSKSLCISVNEDGGSLVYKMKVERATNPVYHNNRQLTVNDIVYLNYGDTIKLGKTLIKVQKVKPNN